MTDAELADYLGIAGLKNEAAMIARITPRSRLAYEAMKTAEEDINLWQQGVAPKPTNVILCKEHKP
jgi:hypothetical protein